MLLLLVKLLDEIILLLVFLINQFLNLLFGFFLLVEHLEGLLFLLLGGLLLVI